MSDELIELKRIGENLQDGVLRRCGHCGETYESRHPGNCPTCGCDNRVGNERFPHFQEAERLRAENQRMREALEKIRELPVAHSSNDEYSLGQHDGLTFCATIADMALEVSDE